MYKFQTITRRVIGVFFLSASLLAYGDGSLISSKLQELDAVTTELVTLYKQVVDQQTAIQKAPEIAKANMKKTTIESQLQDTFLQMDPNKDKKKMADLAEKINTKRKIVAKAMLDAMKAQMATMQKK